MELIYAALGANPILALVVLCITFVLVMPITCTTLVAILGKDEQSDIHYEGESYVVKDDLRVREQ